MRNKILLILFGLLPVWGQAQTGDSLNYLLPQDTIYLQTTNLQQKIFQHEIATGQTLYSLAKFYGLSYNDLLHYNANLVGKTISIGEKVRVPIPVAAIKHEFDIWKGLGQYSPVFYEVKSGETLFHIAKKQFDMTIDTLKMINRLETEVLEIGQKLQIGWLEIAGIPDSLHGEHVTPIERKNMLMRDRFVSKSHVKKEYKEAGVAYWQKNRNAGDQLYALHRKAPVNSVISITNPMTQNVVYVKVIGKLPDNAYSRDVVIVISPKAASLLGAKDPRFYVKLKYLR